MIINDNDNEKKETSISMFENFGHHHCTLCMYCIFECVFRMNITYMHYVVFVHFFLFPDLSCQTSTVFVCGIDGKRKTKNTEYASKQRKCSFWVSFGCLKSTDDFQQPNDETIKLHWSIKELV